MAVLAGQVDRSATVVGGPSRVCAAREQELREAAVAVQRSRVERRVAAGLTHVGVTAGVQQKLGDGARSLSGPRGRRAVQRADVGRVPRPRRRVRPGAEEGARDLRPGEVGGQVQSREAVRGGVSARALGSGGDELLDAALVAQRRGLEHVGRPSRRDRAGDVLVPVVEGDEHERHAALVPVGRGGRIRVQGGRDAVRVALPDCAEQALGIGHDGHLVPRVVYDPPTRRAGEDRKERDGDPATRAND